MGIAGYPEQKTLLNVPIASQGIGRRKKMKQKNEPENPSWVDEIIKLEEEGKSPLIKRQSAENNTDI